MIKTPKEVAESLKRQAKARMAQPRAVWGIPYGFKALDHFTGGIQYESPNIDYCVLISRPGVGKTAFALKVTLNVANWLRANMPGKVLRWQTGEMTPEALQMRLACEIANISSNRVKSGFMDALQARRYFEAHDMLATLPIEYNYGAPSVSELREFIAKDGKCAWWCLDHAGLIKGLDGATSEARGLAAISKALAQLCHDAAPGMIITHLNRQVDLNLDKRPTLANIHGSDQFAKDADLVLSLFRSKMHEQRSTEQAQEPEVGEIHVLKNRDGAANFYMKALFNPKRASWTDDEELNQVSPE